MSKGWPYDKAHEESSHVEYRCRHHPDELHDVLMAEGWSYTGLKNANSGPDCH
jgi:hypothetical protein